MGSNVMRLRSLVIVLLGAIGLSLFASTAAAQTDDPALIGTLRYDDSETDEEVLVEGVVLSVVGPGEFTAAGTSAADGSFRIPVPADGIYAVALDISTLPEGINLRNPDTNPLSAEVNDGNDRRVLFALVEGEASGSGGSSISFRRVAQLTVEGLKQGLYLAMAAIGLSLIYGTTGLVNFAHAELVTFGMLSTYMFNFYGLAGVIGFVAPLPAPFGGGVNLIFAMMLGMVAGGCLGWVLNRMIFKPARAAGVSLIAQMVMTIGLSILLRYLMLYLFRGGPRSFGDFSAQRAWNIGPVDVTPKDLVAMTLSILILLGVASYLEMTRMGKAMRAVSDNRELAESTGIDVERVIMAVWVAGAGLAALGGAFFGLDQVKWDFGFRILLLIFASVTLGGLGSAYGALVGALIVGLTINLSTLFIDAEVKNMVALLIMVVVLMFRPQGILGKAERIG
ncbi:MAG: branched-chain amino acid ABC transporter permease [Acidimicrobiia bacterium]|nr:branched-chain amino acid ABC transporter permease [Acidimicrobiia bacterium]